ncbi:K+-H+ exchange-like protein [Ceratobasidium theobromae]|uniref:K+-H+ exchange-like protein n=1 Tax=Ceratobasidium theobromae TaxID=1582974 RepID=A0A5N5QR94_9AGAM|nr:K+-H+ exchange-like protein [Ceratobasidium theobromae]
MGKPPSTMRLFAFPLTSPRNIATKNYGNRHPLIYYYAQMPKTKRDEREPSLLKRAQDKASQMWVNWGKEPGGWKLKVHTYGEKVVDKVDFEELALASIDTSLGPRLPQLTARDSTGKELSERQSKTHTISIPLIYPPSCISSANPLDNLQQLLAHRSPLHRRRTWFWVGVMPFTAPFALLPIVPNLPFFFCVWRAWTHWKAHKASAYLLELVEQGAIRAMPSQELDKIYSNTAKLLSGPTRNDTKRHERTKFDSNVQVVQLFPNPTMTIPQIIDTYSLPKEAERSFLRAVEQARIRSEMEPTGKS